MNLNEGFVNHVYMIDKMHMKEKEKSRFKRMQICEGNKVMVIQKQRGYPFIIEIEGTRIAFTNKVAKLIEVIPYV